MKKKPEEIVRIGLIANSEKTSARALVQKAARLIAAAGKEVLGDEATVRLTGIKSVTYATTAKTAEAADLLLVFGGDGTILRVVREMNGSRTPILGINVGRLGFLTAVPSQELPSALKKIWAGDFSLETRSLIEANGLDGKISWCALNDIVISRGAIPRMIELEVSVNNEPLTRYRCDGLIVSSPTGSTAYSLSAGGAIVNPNADVFSITPICPHTLTVRSVIVSLRSVIKVKVVSEKVETTITADGQMQSDLNVGDTITIQRSRRSVHLMHLGGSSFFDTVRRKLHWSGSNV